MNNMTHMNGVTDADFKIDYTNLLSPEQFEREVEFVFKKSWLVVGHDLEIPKPGDFLVRDMPGLKANVLITRGLDGVVRAFHNVCRHRGAMLVCHETAGNKRQGMSCPYHGWTYNLDGSLRGITDRDQFPVQDVSDLGLKPIRCEVRHTYIFINFDDDAESLDSWLESLADPTMFEGYFERFHMHEVDSVVLEANWKLVMDNFSEGYHTLFVHKGTLTDYQATSGNPMRHLPVTDNSMKRHSRYGAPANMEHKTIPIEDLMFRHTYKVTPSYYGDSEGLAHGLNFGRLEHWSFDIIRLFPNALFLPGKDFCVAFRVWPLAHDRTLLEIVNHQRTPKTYGERVAQEFAYVLGREVASEDLSLLEKQQKALATGSMKEMTLSYQEYGVATQYRTLRRMIEENAR